MALLTLRQEKRISQEIAALEKDTGYKLRVLAQNYPDTPGMAANGCTQLANFFVVKNLTSRISLC